MKLILVCGDRHWRDGSVIQFRLEQLDRDVTILHGGARGADRIASNIAKALGLHVQEVPAAWAAKGRAAGPIRNRKMLDLEPDLVIAFHADLDGGSKGTKDCVREARRRGIPVEVITG